MFTCQARSYSPPVPLDPAVVRDTILDYGARTFWALVVAAITLLVARAVRGVSMRALARNRAQSNVTVLVGNLTQLTVIAIGALLILAIYTQGAFAWIVTSFSVVGIVIGLSAQDILKNFFAGVWVLIERPFRIGDSIEVTGYTGTVEEIAFRTTQLRTDDGREVIVPNNTFMISPVVNLTRFPTRRASATLILPADEEAVTTEDVRAALEKVQGVSPQPPASVELRSVGDGKAQYIVTFWAANRDAALPQALRALRARFPQGDVRIG
jgi:small conductance mechanosensitive channel